MASARLRQLRLFSLLHNSCALTICLFLNDMMPCKTVKTWIYCFLKQMPKVGMLVVDLCDKKYFSQFLFNIPYYCIQQKEQKN